MNSTANSPPSQDFESSPLYAIVVSGYYKDISDALIVGAVTCLSGAGISNEQIKIYQVPGAFEIPLVCQRLAEKKRFEGIVALGCIIRGQTSHYDTVCHHCANGIMEIQLKFNIAIGFGLLTVENQQQAIERAGGEKGNKGQEAASAMLQVSRLRLD